SRGMLRYTRPDELAALAIQAALERAKGLAAEEIEDVILGCAMPEQEQGMNVARRAAIRATFMPCSCAGMAQPRITSSISSAARPFARSSAACIASAANSSGRVYRSIPRD